MIWTVSNGDVGSSPRRQSEGVKDSDFTTSTSPTPEAWVRVRVKQGGQKQGKKTKDVLRVRARTKAFELTNHQLLDIHTQHLPRLCLAPGSLFLFYSWEG